MLQMFVQQLKGEHRITKTIIEAIPLDKGDYKPDEVAKSAIDLAWHIAMAEMRFMEAVVDGEFNRAPSPRPETIKNSEDLMAWYIPEFNSHIEKLTALTPDQLLKIVDFRGIFQLPAVMYLGFVLHHSIHHRGQLSMYLRPMGAKVPAIYGESYDSAEAKKASQSA